MIKIGIPVECQNGHKATYVIAVNGLDPKHFGVDKSENCSCPKFDISEGWKQCGEPFIIEGGGITISSVWCDVNEIVWIKRSEVVKVNPIELGL